MVLAAPLAGNASTMQGGEVKEAIPMPGSRRMREWGIGRLRAGRIP